MPSALSLLVGKDKQNRATYGGTKRPPSQCSPVNCLAHIFGAVKETVAGVVCSC